MKFIFILLSICLLCDCANRTPQAFSQAATSVTVGMTTNQVFSLLGKPTQRDFSEPFEGWAYIFGWDSTSSKESSELIFLNGRLIEMKKDTVFGNSVKFYYPWNRLTRGNSLPDKIIEIRQR